MNNLVVRINEEEFNSSGYTILKGDLGITLMSKGMDVVKMVTEGCAAEKNLLSKAYDDVVNPKVDKKKLYDGCLWLSDIIDPCFRKLGLNRNHMGLCFLRIKSSWLYKHCRCWYPGYTIYNVKVEVLNDYRGNDFEFEYYRDERDERDKVRRKMMMSTNWDDFMGLDSWAKFYSNSIVKVDVNKPVTIKPLKPKKVIFHGPATIAIWPDGTKTVVKCQKGDDYDAEKAIALVYLKKLYGTNKSKSNYLDNLIKDVEIVDQKAKSIDAGYQKALENAKKRLHSTSDDILESLGILGR